MSIKVNFGFIQADLDQFISAVRDIASGEVDDETKGLVTKMIEETQKLFKETVMSLVPFYKIMQSNEATYLTEYSSQFAVFKGEYLVNMDELGVHCAIITHSLDELLKKRNWLGKIPRLKDSLKKLDDIASNWATTRSTLEITLNNFLSDVNRKLSEINELNKKNAIKESRISLSDFLNGLDESVEKLKLN